MGASKSKNKQRKSSTETPAPTFRQNINNINQPNPESHNRIRMACLFGRGKPINKDEINELYRYESSMCRIVIYETIEKRKIEKESGTGFFCEINDNSIPFKKALFTNNHVLNENRIGINKEIEFEYLKQMKKIEITENRKIFTDSNLDYTCIEIFDDDKIFDKDKINNIFRIDTEIFDNKNNIKDKEIFILQYPNGEKLSHDHGIILDIKDNKIKHSVATLSGSSGSPLIKRYNINLVIGIHYGGDKEKDKGNNEFIYKYTTPFDIIIKDIKNKIFNNKINIINNHIIEFRNKINIFIL